MLFQLSTTKSVLYLQNYYLLNPEPFQVLDAPEKHSFDVLRKLVLLDGSILRARLPSRPTKDCLFTDPARDGGRWGQEVMGPEKHISKFHDLSDTNSGY